MRQVEFSQEKRFRLPWQEPHQEVTLAQVEDRLEKGDARRLHVKPPDAGMPLPLTSAQDLEEVRVFEGLEPVSKLSHPELGTALTDLAGEGWLFHAEPGQVGKYGTYNALTDPAKRLNALSACKGELRVLLDERTPMELRDFLEQSPLARLEEEGYRFLTPRGEKTAAFLAQKEGYVGRGEEAWLPVAEASQANLKQFAEFRALSEDILQVRKAWELAHQPASMGALLGQLSFDLALKAGEVASASPLTPPEVQSQAHHGARLVEQAARVSELSDSVAAGRLWETDLSPESRQLLWQTVLAGAPIQDEATRLQAFEKTLKALPVEDRPKVLERELTRPGADPLLVGNYARQAETELTPVFDRLGLAQAVRWSQAVQSPKARAAIEGFWLKHPREAPPQEKLAEFWQEMRTSTAVANDERARLVRSELGQCKTLGQVQVLGPWLYELDKENAAADLRPVLKQHAQVASTLAEEWCQAVQVPIGQSILCAHLLKANPSAADGPARVELLTSLFPDLPAQVKNDQRARLVESNLAHATDDASRVQMLRWLLELGAPDALEQIRVTLESPELDSWLGALQDESGRKLAVTLAVEHPELSSVDKMKEFWAKAGRQVPNEERAALVQAEFDRLQGEERWTLGAWLVELKKDQAAPSLEKLWQGQPAGLLADEWCAGLGPEGKAAVLGALVRERPDRDTPARRVALLEQLLEKISVAERATLVQANLQALQRRATEDGWPEAMLKLCGWKAELGDPEGVPEFLAAHPQTKPYADELEGWYTALPDGESRGVALLAVLHGPTGSSPEARQERLQEFWSRARWRQDISSPARAALVDWSMGDLLSRPASEQRDQVIRTHLGWLQELQGQAAGDRVVEVLEQLPSEKARAQRLRDWREALTSDAARHALTQTLMAEDAPTEPVALLEKLFSQRRSSEELPNEERAILVGRALDEVRTEPEIVKLAGWLYELKGDEGLPQMLAGLPQEKGKELERWLSFTEQPELRKALVDQVLAGSQNVLLDALIADRKTPNEHRAELVERSLAHQTDPGHIAILLTVSQDAARARPFLEKLGTPAARAAVSWGDSMRGPNVHRAYSVWMEKPDAAGSAADRADALERLFQKPVPPEEAEPLLRYELGQLDRLPRDGERDRAVGQVGARLLQAGQPEALPIVFKLLGKQPAYYDGLVAGADPGARVVIGETVLSHLDLTRPEEVGFEVLTAYMQHREIGAPERIRVTRWAIEKLLDPGLKLKDSLPRAEAFMEKLGQGLYEPAAQLLFERASERFQSTPTVRVSLAAQAGRIAAAPNADEARRLVDEGMVSLKRVQEIEDLMRADQDMSIREEDQAVVVGGVRLPRRN